MIKKDFSDGFYDSSNPNYVVLLKADKITWRKATKTKNMAARKLEKDVEVNSLEGSTKAKKGDFLCMGVAGEFWVQKEANVYKKYIEDGEFGKSVKVKYVNGEEVVYNDFLVFKPKPDRAVLVVQMSTSFKVHASWGELSGKKGDYMVKPFEDGLDSNPGDVWIVNKGLFESTYECTHF